MLDHGKMSVTGRVYQGTGFGAVQPGEAGPVLHEQLERLQSALHGGEGERGVAVIVGPVNVRPKLEEE